MPSFVELRDGRLIAAAMFDPMLTILDSTRAIAARYDMRQHRGFGRITTMGLSQDGRRLLVLDGGRVTSPNPAGTLNVPPSAQGPLMNFFLTPVGVI